MAGTSINPTVAVQIVANAAEFVKTLKSAQADLKQFSNSVKNIASIIGIGFGTREILQFGLELTKLGGEAIAVQSAFNRFNNSIELLGRLKQATGGTVSELELMKSTIQAANFGIEISKLPDLFKFATLRAQQTGQSIDYLVSSIVLGIGRKSPMILDNLGISLIRLREKLKGVGAESASVAQMTQVVSEIMNEDLGKMANFAENAKTSLDRLAASWNNLKAAIGKRGTFNEGIRELELFISDLSGDPLVKAFNLLRLNDPTLGSKKGVGIDRERQVKLLNKALGELKDELIDLAKENGKFTISQQEIADRFGISKDNAQRFWDILQRVNEEYVKIKSSQDAAKIGEVDPISGLAMGAGWQKWTKPPKTQEELDAEKKALEDAEKAWKKYYDRITKGNDIISGTTLMMEMLAGTIRSLRKEIEKPLELPGFKKEGGLNKEDDVFGIKTWVESLRPMIDELDKIQKDFRKKNDEITAMINDINLAFTSSLKLSMEQFFYGFEQLGAKEITFGQNILNAITEFMKMFGRQLVQLGTAKLALDKLISNLGIPAPAIAISAIAAGTALLAVAGAVRKKNDLAIQRTVRLSSDTGGLRSAEGMRLEVTGTLVGSGRDLVAVINQTNYDNRIRKGG